METCEGQRKSIYRVTNEEDKLENEKKEPWKLVYGWLNPYLNYLFKTIVNSGVIYLSRSCPSLPPKSPKSLDPYSLAHRFKEDVKDVVKIPCDVRRKKKKEEMSRIVQQR